MEIPESYRKQMNSWGETPRDDLSRCKNMIEDLALCFNKKLPTEVLQVYARSLMERITLDQAYEATKKIKFSSEMKFFPSMGQIVAHAPGTNISVYEPVECSQCGVSGAIVEKYLDKEADLEYQRVWQCTCPNGRALMCGVPIR